MKKSCWMLLLLLGLAVPASAATVTISADVKRKTAETLGIPAGGVAPQGVRAYQVDEAAVKERANAVFTKNPVAMRMRLRGFSPERSEDERAIKFMNGSIELEVSKAAGAEIFLDLDRYANRETKMREVDEKLFERDARAYIRTHMPDVDPGEVALYSVKKIMDSVARLDDDGKMSEVRSGVANYIIVFQRRIKGVPVVGPGGKIRVYLSSNGEVIGHSKVWRQLDAPRGAAKPIVPPGRVQQALAERLRGHPAKSVEIDFFEFGYFAEGRYTRQDVLNPVYLIGYKGGPEEKRVIKVVDAYTGAEMAPPPDPEGADVKK